MCFFFFFTYSSLIAYDMLAQCWCRHSTYRIHNSKGESSNGKKHREKNHLKNSLLGPDTVNIYSETYLRRVCPLLFLTSLLIFWFFDHTTQPVGSWFPNQGIKTHGPCSRRRVLTTGLPEFIFKCFRGKACLRFKAPKLLHVLRSTLQLDVKQMGCPTAQVM